MHASWIDVASRLSLAVALTSGFTAPAMAADDGPENMVVYSTGANSYTALVTSTGLDLHSPAGAAGLHHRVRIAAVKVCSAAIPSQSVASDPMLDCRVQSYHDAEPQMATMIAEARSANRFADAGPLVPWQGETVRVNAVRVQATVR